MAAVKPAWFDGDLERLAGRATPMNRYSAYDAFARAYCRHWGPRAGETNLTLLKEVLLPKIPAAARILDLCCGAGQLARALDAHGYVVTGLDGSEELLRLAHQHAPGVEFILADARAFTLPSVQDAIVSVFDSLNHVMSVLELAKVFQCAYAALRQDGYFWFDLNREYKYRTTWPGEFSIVEDDLVCVVRARYDPTSKVAGFDATIFEKVEEWKRADVSLSQTWYAECDVCKALASAGFGEVELSYSRPDAPEESDKAYYLCKRITSGITAPTRTSFSGGRRYSNQVNSTRVNALTDGQSQRKSALTFVDYHFC
jgi:SAM-dependent methyltransferase